MGPDGRPRIVVRADTIEQQLADDSVLLARLEMDYTAGKTGVWHVTADRGRMPPNRESLLLAGNVHVTGEPAGATGRRCHIDRRTRLRHAHQCRADCRACRRAVRAARIIGRGMRVRLNDGTLRLESNVNGHFTP